MDNDKMIRLIVTDSVSDISRFADEITEIFSEYNVDEVKSIIHAITFVCDGKLMKPIDNFEKVDNVLKYLESLNLPIRISSCMTISTLTMQSMKAINIYFDDEELYDRIMFERQMK